MSTSYSDQVTGFDGVEKSDALLKKSFGYIATHEATDWFNETFGKSILTIESDSINVAEPPDEPIWDDISMTNSELNEYDICINVANSFHTDKFTGIQEAYYNGSTKYYRTDGTYTPGAYLDSTKTLILFVALRLDFMETFSSGLTRGDETSSGGNARNKSLSFTKYPNDSSLNSVLSNSFQTNYKKQVGTFAKENGTTISTTLNHYKYTLEYPNSNGVRQELAFSEGNWFFDFKSGVITFSDDPGSNYKFDNDQGANQDYLYLTFVKYVGPTGLKKMLSVDPDFASNSSNSGYYEDQVVIDSTNKKMYYRKDGDWDLIGANSSSVSSGIGTGYCPIGTIIMWGFSTGPPSDYGTWLLCNGDEVNKSTYSELATALGLTDNTFNIPNLGSYYIRGGDSGNLSYSTNNKSLVNSSNNTAIGGSATRTLNVNNLPVHYHSIPTHQHNITSSIGNHNHSWGDHTHQINIQHSHSTNANHTHLVTASSTSHTYTPTTQQHTHTYHRLEFSLATTERGNKGSNAIQAGNFQIISNTSTSHGDYDASYAQSVIEVDDIDISFNTGNVASGAALSSNNSGWSSSCNDAIFNDTDQNTAQSESDTSQSTQDVGQNSSGNSASFNLSPIYVNVYYYIRAK